MRGANVYETLLYAKLLAVRCAVIKNTWLVCNEETAKKLVDIQLSNHSITFVS